MSRKMKYQKINRIIKSIKKKSLDIFELYRGNFINVFVLIEYKKKSHLPILVTRNSEEWDLSEIRKALN